MKRIVILIFVLPLIVGISAYANNTLNDNADAIVGEYLVRNEIAGNSKVRFTKNREGTYDCQVVWLQFPTDPKTGKPWLDQLNPDKSRRNERCDRLFIVRGLKYNAAKHQWDGAKVYDPSRGIYANLRCRFLPDGELEIHGSLLGIGESQQWQKL